MAFCELGNTNELVALQPREEALEHELVGMRASVFVAKFLEINSDLIVRGGVYHYPADLGRTHHTKTSDHAPRTLTNTREEVVRSLQEVEISYADGNLTSSALSFELAPEKFGLSRPTVASLIGIDVEAPVSNQTTKELISYCNKKRVPFVLMQAAERSYFLILMGQVYRNNIYLFKDYLGFIEGFEGMDKTWDLFKDFYYGRMMGDITDPNYAAIADTILQRATHKEDLGHELQFDVRHFAHSINTNTRTRANASDPRQGNTFQFCMRMGEKTGDDEFKVIASSRTVPLRIENLRGGSVLLTPEVFYNCGLN